MYRNYPDGGPDVKENMKYNILILGASYGSLFSTKLLMAGHNVSLVCTKGTADLINREGTVVRMPIKGRESLLDISSKKLPGTLSAATPDDVDPGKFDLIVLGMQEAQYGAPGVRELTGRVALSRKPCLAIMNMPPLPYLKRIPGLETKTLEVCYADPDVWKDFEPRLMTLASPDPQAFRPPDQPKNVLQVGLPTNFKAARFESDADTAMLRELADGIEAARYEVDGESVDLPVKLKVHESVFVPLAKWAMLISGNYRCVTKDGIRPIKEAVHGDVEASRAMYNWVVKLCVSLGANEKDLVPFEKYAAAAQSLGSPSSAARALAAGAPYIERVDRLVQAIAAQKGMRSEVLDEVVRLVDAKLEANRKAADAGVKDRAKRSA